MQQEQHSGQPTSGSHIMSILRSRDGYHLKIFHLMTLTRRKNLILWEIFPPMLSSQLVLVRRAIYVLVPLIELRHALSCKHFGNLESSIKILLRKLFLPLYTNKNVRTSSCQASTHHNRNFTTTQCSWHATSYILHFLICRNHDLCFFLIILVSRPQNPPHQW